MRLRFLGGAAEVGRLAMLLEQDGARLLFDYGLSPTDPPQYPQEAPPVDMAFLSHAHLDHSGMMAWIAGKHGPPTVMTRPTWAMSELLAHDNIKVAKAEGYPVMYGKEDIATLASSLTLPDYREKVEAGPLGVRLHSAGHIPGSTMYEVKGSKTLLFTGDINVADTHLVWGAHPVKCDTLVIEGTYSGREHPSRGDVERRFRERVEEVVDGGGLALVPAFAVGRTQELLLILADMGLEVWLDGMGRDVARMLLQNQRYLRDPGRMERALRSTKVVHSSQGRKLALEGDVIVTTSGMLEGGPVLGYLDRLRHGPEHAVFLTGYQVKGTNGRRLVEEGVVELGGVPERIKCQVDIFDFSAHAGHSDLVEFIRACDPEEVVIMHSDQPEHLRDALGDRYRVILPRTGEAIELR